MNISQWFIRPEELVLVKNLYLLNVTSEVLNDIETDEQNNYWKYRSFDNVREIIRNKYQISQETDVVLYTKGELMMAARFAWLLYWMGCRSIRILIGHTDPSWFVHRPCRLLNLPNVPRRPHVRLTCKELAKEFLCSRTTFIDVRTYREYTGETTGYCYVRRTGRIPNFQYDLLDGIYEDIKGDITWKELEGYLQMMSKTTTSYDKHTKRLVYMCGTGWRASLAAIFAAQLNLAETITVLDSGWFEWSEQFLD